jgi:hypothetical protein
VLKQTGEEAEPSLEPKLAYSIKGRNIEGLIYEFQKSSKGGEKFNATINDPLHRKI